MLWDIFCEVIDNFGDIGVCWRLSRDLAARGQSVRLWVNDGSALAWLAPGGTPGVTVHPWATDTAWPAPGGVVVEAFGCELPAAFVARMAVPGERTSLWLNLEYLTAEPYAQRCHLLHSPVMTGPGKGLTKYFYYPGFTPQTGGLLCEPDLARRKAGFRRGEWLDSLGLHAQRQHAMVVSLFCYEPAALEQLLSLLAAHPTPVELLVTAGRAADAVRALDFGHGPHRSLSINYLPRFTQLDFDHLLWASDLNFVRGEDSLVRALWAEKPFVWQLYPQDDNAHAEKLDAFLEWRQASPAERQWHLRWNGLQESASVPLPALRDLLTGRGDLSNNAALAGQGDLVTQLLDLARGKHAKIQGFAEKTDPTLT